MVPPLYFMETDIIYKEEAKVPLISASAENTLKTIATIILICGLLATLVLLLTTVFVEKQGYYKSEVVFNPTGFAMTLGCLLSTLASWSALKVFANISLRLKGIQETIPRRLVEIKEKTPIINEPKPEINEKGISDLKVGDKVTWKLTMNEYVIKDIKPGKVYIDRGFAGSKWISVNELIIPQDN